MIREKDLSFFSSSSSSLFLRHSSRCILHFTRNIWSSKQVPPPPQCSLLFSRLVLHHHSPFVSAKRSCYVKIEIISQSCFVDMNPNRYFSFIQPIEGKFLCICVSSIVGFLHGNIFFLIIIRSDLHQGKEDGSYQ